MCGCVCVCVCPRAHACSHLSFFVIATSAITVVAVVVDIVVVLVSTCLHCLRARMPRHTGACPTMTALPLLLPSCLPVCLPACLPGARVAESRGEWGPRGGIPWGDAHVAESHREWGPCGGIPRGMMPMWRNPACACLPACLAGWLPACRRVTLKEPPCVQALDHSNHS